MNDTTPDVRLMLGDCLERMQEVDDQSVDLVLCDLPYGTTQNAWDSVLPLDQLWAHYWRVCTGTVVLTAAQPFSSMLVTSCLYRFRYEWIWRKTKITGVLNAKRMPVRCHEQILVFGTGNYNAQNLMIKNTVTKQGTSSKNYGERNKKEYVQEFSNWPRDVLDINSEGKSQHPTQKPVALMDYMIRTYTNPGAVVLDNCMGSGTTGVAALEAGRRFIGIERDAGYFAIAERRIKETDAYRILCDGE